MSLNQSRQFILIFSTIVCLVLTTIVSFNYVMDPLWTFNQKHKFNDYQSVIDERQQKTGRMFFQPFSYDTILLGSSRSTYINQNKFTNMNVYNFSVNNLSIREYDTFLAFAKRQSDQPIKRVIIGLDFFKSSVQESERPVSLVNYEKKLDDPLYRVKTVFSIDSFRYSIKNLRMSLANKVLAERAYNHDNVAFARYISDEERNANTAEKIERFKEEFYGSNYVYNPRYKEYLTIFTDRHPDVDTIVYTTPISMALFQTLVEEGQLDDYEQWLHDVVNVFGGVYNFMYPNEITNDLTNYFDGHHFYPEVGDKIAERINEGPNAQSSFGIYITKENIDSHLAEIHKKIEMMKR